MTTLKNTFSDPKYQLNYQPITLVFTEPFGHQKTMECFLISSWGKVEPGVIRNLNFS